MSKFFHHGWVVVGPEDVRQTAKKSEGGHWRIMIVRGWWACRRFGRGNVTERLLYHIRILILRITGDEEVDT